MPVCQEHQSTPHRRTWAAERIQLDREVGAAFAAMSALPPDSPDRSRHRTRIITTYLPLSRRLARRYHTGGETLDDLEQVAAIGLLKAVDRFDPCKGRAFAAYAIPTVTGELRRHFRDCSGYVRVPRALHDLNLRIRAASEDLHGRFRRLPTVPELAGYLRVPDESVIEAVAAADARRPLSLDLLDNGGPSGGINDKGSAETSLSGVEDRVAVGQLLAVLPGYERRVVWLRFWRRQSQAEIAEAIGVSQMQVSRVLARALNRMRRQADAESTQ